MKLYVNYSVLMLCSQAVFICAFMGVVVEHPVIELHIVKLFSSVTLYTFLANILLFKFTNNETEIV